MPSDSQPTTSRLPRLGLGLAVVTGFVLLSGVAHGYLDGRWSTPEDLTRRGAQLLELPEQCGDWELAAQSELDETAQGILRCYGSTVRTYVHSDSGAQVNVAVLFGPRGPIAVHTPEICYSSVGTEQVGSREVETIRSGDQEHELWSVQFAKRPEPEPSFEVWYAWSNGRQWVASEHPRFWLTDSLYKIQVSGPAVAADSVSPCKQFLSSFLSQLDGVIR